MPALDFTDVILDPDVSATSFDVIRRPIVMVKGRATTPAPVTYESVLGSINSASPEDLKRLEDYQVSQKVISIVTQFRLQLESPGYNADEVLWHGSTYVVKWVDDYTIFGAGQIQALAVSMTYNDPPPPA